MDKTVILAVAGSGKTTQIINQLDGRARTLIVTYTNNNIENLRGRIISKFDRMPENIHLFSYFSFIYSFCYKPFLHSKLAATGMNFKPCENQYAQDLARYKGRDGRLYSNRIAKLLDHEGVTSEVIARISKYFDRIFIDEIQDFGGHDFNFLKCLTKAGMPIVFVGDYFQHTFDTSRDGNVNKNLHSDHQKYINAFSSMGMKLDLTSLSKSHRCSPTICEFITASLGIDIKSHRQDAVKIVSVDDQAEVDMIFANNHIVKLFYREGHKYDCHARNWGETKGDDKYQDVCVVLNDTTLKSYKEKKLASLPPQTKNKLYVAITRAKNDLYFIPEKMLKSYKKN